MYCSSAWSQIDRQYFFIDPQWRDIIAETVGEFVFITRDPAWSVRNFGGTAFIAILSIVIGLGRSTLIGRRYSIAATATTSLACAAHFVLVDRLGVHPALQACPMRASLWLMVAAYVGNASEIVRRWRSNDLVSRGLSVATFTLSIGDFESFGTPAIAALMLVGVTLDRLKTRSIVSRISWPTIAVTATTVGAIGASVIFFGAERVRAKFNSWSVESFTETLARTTGWNDRLKGWKSFREGSIDRNLKRAQRWIADRSYPSDRVMPPWFGGVREYSRRSFTMSEQFATYTHLSRDRAMNYRRWLDEIAKPAKGRGFERLVEAARRQSAVWLLVDLNEESIDLDRHRPLARYGRYAVYRVESNGEPNQKPASGEGR
jgi:hypothetical protein